MTYVLAAAAATQSVLDRLGEMGIVVTPAHRVSATWHDLVGMAGSFLPLLAAGLLIAFAVTALLNRLLPGYRRLLFVLAGAAAVVTVHVALKLAFDITPVAATRTPGGLAVQALAGAAGGYVYALADQRRLAHA